MKCAAQGGNDTHRIHRWQQGDRDTRRRGPFYLPQWCKNPRAQRWWWGRRGGDSSAGRWIPTGTGRFQSYRVCYVDAVEKTTELSGAVGRRGRAVFNLATRGRATKADGRVSGGEVPGSQRDKDTHTPEDFVSITYTTAEANNAFCTAALRRFDSAP